MSAPTYVQRCREQIREQIDGMGTLRTSNSRDLAFKSWRQNTVTVLQRIWPEDLERVERFRRIVFTPPHSRADTKLSREWFGKGLGESRTYLQSLLDIIDREGVPDPAATDREDHAGTMEDEVGFPMLDLDEAADTADAIDEDAAQAEDESGLGVTVGYTTPDDQGASPRDGKAPAPPALNLNSRTPTPSGLRLRDALLADASRAPDDSDEQDGRQRRKDDRPPVQIPRAPSLAKANEAARPASDAEPAQAEPADDDQCEAEAEQPAVATPKLSSPRPGMTVTEKPSEPAKPAATAKPTATALPRPGMTVAAKPAEPANPVATGPARPGMTPAAKPAATAPRPVTPAAAKPAAPARPGVPTPAPRPAAPAASKPAEPVKPAPAAQPSEARTEPGSRVEARGKNARGKQQKKSGPRQKLKDLLGLSQFDSRTHEEANEEFEAIAEVEMPFEAAPEAMPEPEAEPVEPEPVAEAADPESYDDEIMPVEDEEDRERATLDFMQNSPVFGVVGKPVNRKSDTTEFLDPDAVAVATLADDVGRLGVPEGMRASIAARLTEVAKRLDEGELDWALLRGTVTDAMQYPDLAKRLLPILLPWLERAA